MIPLFVDLETEWRGGQSQALLLLKGLYERGHPAELITVKGSPLARRARREGIYVHGIRPNMRRLRASMLIRSVLSDGRIDLVHVNEPHALTAAWLAGAHRRVPLLVSRRVANPIKKGPLALGRYLAAERILAITEFVKKSVLESGVPAEFVEVVNEGVQVPSLPSSKAHQEARARWGVRGEEVLFGCVGYLLPEKGQELVVRALPAVRAKFPGTRLLLAGRGPCQAQLETLARELGIDGAVIFAGFVEEVSQVYAALDAFVFPSLAEPLGTSLLAAMAWGLPSVAVASGGVPEYVVNDANGLLVAHPDQELLSTEMIRLLGDSNLAKRLGLAARATVEERFSADRMVDNTLALYQQVI